MLTLIEWTGRTGLNTMLATLNGKLGYMCALASAGCRGCYAQGLNMDPRAKNSSRRGTGLMFTLPNAALLEPVLKLEPAEKLLRSRKRWLCFPNDMLDWMCSVVACPTCEAAGEREDRTVRSCPQCGSHDLRRFWSSDWIQQHLDIYDQAARRGHVLQTLTKRTTRLRRELLAFRRRTGRNLHENVWIGFSAENQDTFEARWRDVKQCRRWADGKLWCSFEPLLSEVSAYEAIRSRVTPTLDWAVVGGESKTRPLFEARPFDLQWAGRLVSEFRHFGKPLFVKQLGANPVASDPWFEREGKKEPWAITHKKGGAIEDFPEGLRVREMPELPPGVELGK